MRTSPSLAAVPESWYHVCRARALRPGQIKSWTLGTHAIVVYRTASGRVVAMDARCPHMGAHLGRGIVVGDDLQCALHHWRCGPGGDCRQPSSSPPLSQRTYPTTERYGSIFVFAGREPRFDIPDLLGGSAHAGTPLVASVRSVEVQTSWAAVATNAFDVAHMDAVHHRALREEPGIRLVGAECLELSYVSRVTGDGLSDRAMRWLSGDSVRATIQCWGGTLVVVRSRAGRLESHLLLCLTPRERGVLVTPIVARPRRGPAIVEWLALGISRWLFTAFLRRDVEPLAGMDIRLDGALASRGPLGWAARWLVTLPAFAPADDPWRSSVQISARVTIVDVAGRLVDAGAGARTEV